MWFVRVISLLAPLAVPLWAAGASIQDVAPIATVSKSSENYIPSRVENAAAPSPLSIARSLSKNKISFDGGALNKDGNLGVFGTGDWTAISHIGSLLHMQAELPAVKNSSLAVPAPQNPENTVASPVKTEEGFKSYFNETLSEINSLIGYTKESQYPQPTFLHRMDPENPPLIDRNASRGLVATIISDAVGFTGHCYQYVLEALVKSGIVLSFKADPTQTHAAYQFDEFVKHHQALHGRQFKEIDPNTRPLPIGSIIVWAPGEGKFSRYDGHIEIVVSNNPPQACSDGCERINMDLLSQATQDAKVKLYIISR